MGPPRRALLGHPATVWNDVFAAECDWEQLERHVGVSPRLTRPGHVRIGDVDVLWQRIGVEAWEAAWREARTFFERDGHRPA